MVNVGLRAYVWNKKDRSQQVTRELWSLNGSTYHAYRQYLARIKETGFPEQAVAEATLHKSDSQGPSTPLQTLTSLAKQTSLAWKSSRAFAFAGMKQIFDQGKARTSCLRFGHNSSELLAWGSEDGSVRVATLEEPPHVLHELCMHKRHVQAIDWSPDNLLLISAAEDGGVCLWHAQSGQLMRTFMLGSAATSCRFLQSNANFVLVGTAAGEVHVLNCSTALTHEKVQLAARGPHKNRGGVTAMDIGGALLFVASTSGCLLVYRIELRLGMLQPLQVIFRTPPPARKSRSFQVANMVYSPYTYLAQGPALLVSLSSCHLCIVKVMEASGALDVVVQTRMPPAARKLKATFCPSDDVTEPEYIAMGGEDTGVYIYDISQPPAQVITELQGHMAPVVDVSWSADNMLLASCDCDGVVIVWKRQPVLKAL